ncbi:MAG: ABC transporter ATP-binding protein [Clostridia bacterium]|nr:ABC transporter ATP-binding protein [Clostridia bacterium]
MILKAESIAKRYFRKTGEANYFYAVKPVDLTLESGTVTVLMGRSGSGKTTLLNMLSGLLWPSEGQLWLGETNVYSLDDWRLSRLRNEQIGVVPQGRSAIDTLTVMENVLLPGALYGKADKTGMARKWLEEMGIGHLADARPGELSGGELRRMAIARAMTMNPQVILADEPTGDLDDENTALVLNAFRTAASQGKIVFLVTHETDALRYTDRAFQMDAGEIQLVK